MWSLRQFEALNWKRYQPIAVKRFGSRIVCVERCCLEKVASWVAGPKKKYIFASPGLSGELLQKDRCLQRAVQKTPTIV
jgi:hypothetical protein